MKKQEEYIPVKDYAKKHNMSFQNVYKQLSKGKLEGKKIGSFQLVKDIPS